MARAGACAVPIGILGLQAYNNLNLENPGIVEHALYCISAIALLGLAVQGAHWLPTRNYDN